MPSSRCEGPVTSAVALVQNGPDHGEVATFGAPVDGAAIGGDYSEAPVRGEARGPGSGCVCGLEEAAGAGLHSDGGSQEGRGRGHA